MTKVHPWSFYLFNLRLRQPTDYSRFFEYPKVLELMDMEPGKPLELLDVGSGRLGQFPLFMAAKFPYLRVCSSDPRADFDQQRKYVRALRLDAALHSGRLRLEPMDILSPVFPDAVFDRITCISTVEHIPGDGDSRAMQQMARLLKVGGLLVISIPYNHYRSGLLFRPRRAYHVPGAGNATNNGREFFERIYDPVSLRERLVVPSGLSIERVVYFGEPGFSFGRFIDRGYWRGDLLPRLLLKTRAIQLLIPWISSTFLREIEPQDYDAEDWSGVGIVASLRKT